MNFRFVMVVWGEWHTDLFLRFTLPNELSPGNIPGFPYRDTSRYTIYTTSKDAESIRQSRGFSILSELMATEFILIDDLISRGNKYGVVTDCQRRAMVNDDREPWALVTLYPDEIYSDGSFQNIATIAATGKRAILAPGLRLIQETFVPELLKRFYREDDFTIKITSRELVNLALAHLHPRAAASFWNSTVSNLSPSLLLWNVANEGVLMRQFSPGPLMVYPRSHVTRFSETIDGGDYLRRAFQSFEDLYVVEDSDEILCVSVSSSKTHRGRISNTHHNVFRTALWAAQVTNGHNRYCLKHKVRLHFTDVSARWEQVERASDRVVVSILFLLRFRTVLLLIGWRESLKRFSLALRNSPMGSRAARVVRRLRDRLFATNRGESIA